MFKKIIYFLYYIRFIDDDDMVTMATKMDHLRMTGSMCKGNCARLGIKRNV